MVGWLVVACGRYEDKICFGCTVLAWSFLFFVLWGVGLWGVGFFFVISTRFYLGKGIEFAFLCVYARENDVGCCLHWPACFSRLLR